MPRKPKAAAAAKTTAKKPTLTIAADCARDEDGFGALPFVVCNRNDMSVARADVSKLKARLFESGYEADEIVRLAGLSAAGWDPREDPLVGNAWALVAVFSGDDEGDAPFALLARPANASAPWPFPKGKEGESGPEVRSEAPTPEPEKINTPPAQRPRKGFFLPPKTRLMLVKVTPHKEHHGKDLVQAISLRLRWEATGEALNLLHPNLQDMIFWRRPAVEAQDELPDLPQIKPNLRVPTAVLPLKIDAEYTGYTFEVEYGIDESTALELYTCHLQKFTADGKEGGTSPIEWSLHSNKNITPELVGILCGLEGTTITADLIPPTVTTGDAIDGTVGHPGAGAAADTRDAGDLFREAHAPGGGAEGAQGETKGAESETDRAKGETAEAES